MKRGEEDMWVTRCGVAMFGKGCRKKKKKMEDKMGWLFGVWVVECVFCEK